MNKSTILRIVSFLASLVSMIYLLESGVSFWATILIISGVGLLNYFDGLTREKRRR